MAQKMLVAEIYAQTILEHVHHNTATLDTLVDDVWTTLQQNLVLGEKVKLNIKIAEKAITGKVTAVHLNGVNKKAGQPSTETVSPSSSDKENKDDDISAGTKKMLLPHKYSIQLDNDAKVISFVPVADIQRAEKTPTKDLIRSYITGHASQCGRHGNAPWAVNDECIKQYHIKHKIASLFLSPNKTTSSQQKDTTSRKRKSSSHSEVSNKKRVKMNGEMKGEMKEEMKPSKNTNSSHRDTSAILVNGVSSSTKQKPSEKSSGKRGEKRSKSTKRDKTQKKESKSTNGASRKPSSKSLNKKRTSSNKHASPVGKDSKKTRVGMTNDSSDEDLVLSTLNALDNMPLVLLKKLTPRKSTEKAASGTKRGDNKDKRTPQKGKGASPKDSAKKKLKFDVEEQKSGKGSSRKKAGGLKQVTLFDLKQKPKKDSAKTQSKKSPRKISPPKTPHIIVKLMKSIKDGNKTHTNLYLKQAALTLTSTQRSRLPAEVKDIVIARYDRIQELKLLSKMTPQQRAAYKRKKQEENRKVHSEKRKKQEDTLLTLSPLPAPKLVPTPDGMPNEYFGDVAMLSEFIACYSGLLLPEGQTPINADELMKSIVGGLSDFLPLAQSVVVLLQTLLQDPIAQDYKEIGVPLHDIPVSVYTSSELIRLCLRPRDHMNDDGDDGDNDMNDMPLENLDSQVLYELPMEEKMYILRALFMRIMNTYSVQDYMDTTQQNSAKLWTKRLADTRAKNKQLADDQKKQEDVPDEAKKPELKTELDKTKGASSLTLNHFYGVKSSTPVDTPDTSGTEDSGADLTLVAKLHRRRELAAMSLREKDQRDAVKKTQYAKEKEEERKEREGEQTVKACLAAYQAAQAALRRVPLGTDRNHSRYWELPGVSPGVYVEKGWVGAHVNYCTRTGNHGDEFTIPHTGQNLWFVYTTPAEITHLIAALHAQGARESALQQALKKREATLGVAPVTPTKTEEGEGVEIEGDMVEAFKTVLSDTQSKLRNGGLGGVADIDVWEARLKSARDVATLTPLLREVQENVLEKFRQGIMGKKTPRRKVDENDENDEEEVDVTPKGITTWQENVTKCTTISRLHVLACILDNCIKWEKSAENAKCRICRRKEDDAMLLLCDECNSPYHLWCLRPAMHRVPEGDWLCPACQPSTERRRSRDASRTARRVVDYDSGVSEASDGEVDEEVKVIEHDTDCRMCGSHDREVVECTKCPSIYHLECHDPPLRHAPRGAWECTECKTGVRFRKAGRRSGTSRRPPPRKRADSSDEEEGEETEDEESNDETVVEESSGDEEENQDYDDRGRNQSAQLTNERSRNNKYSPRTNRENEKNAREKARDNREASRNGRSEGRRSGETSDYIDSRRMKCNRGPSYVSLCEEILNNIAKHESSWPFLEPVNKRDVPDYLTIIHTPMDLSKVRDKLNLFHYPTPDLFISDVTLIFQNAETYNSAESEVYNCMEQLKTEFKHLISKLLPDYAPPSPHKPTSASQRRPRVVHQ